jgi:putative transposase
MTEHRQYKYPLYPTKEQAEELTCWIGCGRWIWNYAVQINKIHYEIDKKFLWRFDLQDQLPFLKELYPWLDEVPASALQNKIQDYDKSLKKAVKDRKLNKKKPAGFPSFKHKSDTGLGSVRISLVLSKDKETKKIKHRNINFHNQWIKIPGIGWTRYERFRPMQGRLLNITISNEHDRWWVTCCCETNTDTPGQYLPTSVDESEIVGIDLGLKTFAVLSDKESIETPKFYRNKEERLKQLQRRLAKKQKSSKNRAKARKKLNNAHYEITNQRNGFHIHHASSIAKNYKMICIEDLNIAGMIKNHKLAKSIQDQAWGGFINQLIYFSLKNCGITIKIDRWAPSTKACSDCGCIRPITLNERTYICSACGLIMDRDDNASINIKTWGKTKALEMGIQITDRAGTSQISNVGIIKPGDSDAYFGGSVRNDSRCASMTQEYLSIGLEAATSLESQ